MGVYHLVSNTSGYLLSAERFNNAIVSILNNTLATNTLRMTNVIFLRKDK